MSSCLMFGKCNRGWSDAYVKERRAELALIERETGADFKRCDGVACVKVLIEQCNYGQSSIGDKTAYCRLPSSWQRSIGK